MTTDLKPARSPWGLRLAMLSLSWATLAGPALAQQPSQAQIGAIRQSCRTDYQEHCAGVPTGGSAALACLQRNSGSLSPACEQAVSALSGPPQQGQPPPPPRAAAPRMSPREEAKFLRAACGRDYRTYCRGVRPGGGQAMACLKENAMSLSPGCQRALASVHSG